MEKASFNFGDAPITFMTREQQLTSIIESVKLVAAPHEIQIAALPKFVLVTDEIALTFGDAYLLVPQLVTSGLIDPIAARALKDLDDWFDQMPQDGSVVDTKSLESHEFWKTARRLAATALNALGHQISPPNLSHVKWVGGD